MGELTIRSKRKAIARRNQEITAPTVRVTGPEGESLGIMPIADALAKAVEATLDLVEISPTAAPPVCRIMDYGKYVFETSKRKTQAKKKQKQIKVKEIKFRPGTEEGDYQVKLRNLISFLEGGDKAKITVRFRGREMAHQEIGQRLLNRLEEDLSEVGVVEQYPKMEARQMIMVLAPKKAKPLHGTSGNSPAKENKNENG